MLILGSNRLERETTYYKTNGCVFIFGDVGRGVA